MGRSVSLLHRFLLTTLVGGLIPLHGQSYQTSFSEVKFDRAKSPATFNAGVRVDVASGAASMDIPMGPGIGARGLSYQPTLNFKVFPQFGISSHDEYYLSMAGTKFEHTDSITIDQLYGKGSGGASINPGVFDLKLIGIGAPLQSTYSLPSGGGGTVLGEVPADMKGNLVAAKALLARFGIQSNIGNIPNNSSATKIPMIQMSSSGHIIIGLEGDVTDFIQFNEYNSLNNYWNFPRKIIVVTGETAYEFSYTNHRYGRKLRPYLAISETNPLYSAHYVITKSINRFGESIAFSYGANGIDFTATHSTTGNKVKLEYIGTQSIPQTLNMSTGPEFVSEATKLKISYSVSNISVPSYTILAAAPYGVALDNGGPTSASAQSPQGDRRIMDDIDDHSNWGSSLQGLQLISVTRDADSGIPAEPIEFQYENGDACGWNGMSAAPVILRNIVYPNRRITLGWSSYWYRISYSPNAWGSGSSPNRRPAIAYGVTTLTDKDLASNTSRLTNYTRTVPQLNWSMDPTGVEAWTSTAFYAAVQEQNGQTRLHLFVSPADASSATTGDDGLKNLCYLKHLEKEIRYYAQGVSWQSEINGGSWSNSNAYKIIAKDRFDTRSIGNPNGDLDKNSIPYATRTRTWDRESKIVSYEEMTDWDSTNFAWKKSHKVNFISSSPTLGTDLRSLAAKNQPYVSPGANLGAEETTTRIFDNKISEWLFNRITKESSSRESDNTGFFANGTRLSDAKPSLEKTIDSVFNTPNSITLSNDGWWVKTALISKGTSGIAASQLQSATLTGSNGVSNMINSSNVGVSAYGYDANGFMNSISVKPNESTTLTTQQSQDPLGRANTQLDPDGRVKTIQWDAIGRLKSITPPGEVATEIIYHNDFRGITLQRGVQEQKFRYNGFGEMVIEARKDPNGAWSHKIHGYDYAGRSSGETPWLTGDGSDHETTWKEADFAVLTTVTVPGADRCVRWGYDEDGNRVCMQWQSTTTTTTTRAPLPHTTIAYDGRGRVTSTTDLNGTVTQYAYASWPKGGQKSVTISPGTDKAQTTTYQSDALGRLVRVLDAIGNRTDYLFDGADRIGEVDQYDRNGRVQPRTWRYNALGWLTSLGQPESGTTSYSAFTVQGKPTITSYNGRVVSSTLDWLGRPTAVSSEDGTISQGFSYEPANGRGKLGSSRDGSIYTTFGYDEATGKLNSLETKAAAQTITQTFTYDSYGNRTGANTGHASWSQSFHDASGMPNRIIYNGTIVTNTPWTSYDPTSWMPKNIFYGNGAASEFTYGPDQVRLAGMKHLDAVSSVQANWSYDYDSVGNIWRENDLQTQSSDQYAYDKLNRLIMAVIQSSTYGDQLQQFAYDDFGNRISSTTDRVVSWSGVRAASTPTTATTSLPNVPWLGLNAADPALCQRNQLPAAMTNGALTGARYDLQGNLEEVFEKPGGSSGTIKMTYDALGRVTSVAHTGKGTKEVYQYRADGLRTVIEDYLGGTYQKTRIQIYNDVRQLVSQWQKAPGGSLTWKRDIIYLGTREAAEFDAAGMHVTQVDHLGSPRVITGPNGRVEGKQKYLPFGELLERSGTIPAKGYTNHEQTDASGLIYMQARFYIPWFGRFASPDPARDQHFEFTQSWNIASYVRNNPVMSVDPTGMETDPKDKVNTAAQAMSEGQGTGSQSSNDMANSGAANQAEEIKKLNIKQIVNQPCAFDMELRSVWVVSNGSSGDYNATAFMMTNNVSYDSGSDSFSFSGWNNSGQCEIRTIPDNNSVGAPTENGTYTWKDWNHPENRPSGLPTVQLLTSSGSGVLPTSSPNPEQSGRCVQTGINVHPPNATSPNPARRWDPPTAPLASPSRIGHPFSRGCHIPEPGQAGMNLINFMRGHRGAYELYTMENAR